VPVPRVLQRVAVRVDVVHRRWRGRGEGAWSIYRRCVLQLVFVGLRELCYCQSNKFWRCKWQHTFHYLHLAVYVLFEVFYVYIETC
jgi:hypothetical protein